MKRGRASPRQIEKLLGHCCFISLARREALSIFGHVYSFVHRNGDPHKEVPLWPTVRKEFDVWDGILPLIWRDYTSPWSEKVYAVDASEWGLGCTAANMDVKMVQQIGSFCERWRFKDPLVAKARASVEIDPHDMYPVQLPLSYDDTPAEPNQEVWQHFMPVPFEAVQREWKTVGRHKWLRQSSMPVSEARATLYAVKHMLRGVDGFGRRHLVLTDSMTAACAFSRGRAHTWELRRVCQQFGALTMATSCHVHLRWVPSEWNPADSPSRGGWAPSIPSRFFGNGDSQDHSVRAAFEMGSSLSGSALSGCKVVEEESKHLSPFDFRRIGDRNQPYAKKLEERRQKGSEETPDTTLSQADNPPTAFGFKQLLQPISGTLGSGEKHGASSFRSFAKDFDHRSTAGESFGDFVPGGGGREHWSLCHSRGDLFQTRVEVTKDDQSANLQAEPMWLEQTLSSQKPPSSAVGSYSIVGDACIMSGGDVNSNAPLADVLLLPSAQRGPSGEENGCGETCERGRCGIQHVDSDFAPFGSRHPIEDPRVRRKSSARLGVSQKRGPASAQDGFACYPHCHHSQSHAQTVAEFSRRCNSDLAADDFGFDPSVSIQTRRCLPRRGKSPSGLDSSSGKRTLEVHAISAEIPKGSSPKSDLRPAPQQCSKKAHSGSKTASRQTCCPALKLAKSLPPRFFIEIFSGSGRLGRCVSKDNNIPVLLWDIQYGPEYDLRSLKKRQLIAGWMRAGFICGGHLGTPCNSFTRARDNPPGPPPLRSNAHVLGLPNLAVHDQKKVKDGNLFMRFSVFNSEVSFGPSHSFFHGESSYESFVAVSGRSKVDAKQKHISANCGILHVRHALAQIHDVCLCLGAV